MLKLFFILLLASTILADTAYLWHITDTHLDPAFVEGSSAKDKCEKGTGDAPKYSCHECDSSLDLLKDTIKYMASVKSDNVHVLWTGDDISHWHNNVPDDPYYALGTIQNTTDLLSDSFGSSVLPVLGNHDTHPEGQLVPGPNWLLSNVSKMWSGANFINDSQIETFQFGGYYAADLPRTNGKCQLLAINTDWYYHPNKKTPHTGDTDGQLDWLTRRLEEAQQQGRKVLISGHIPVGGTPGGGYSYNFDHSVLLSAIIEKYADIIVGQMNGHLHSDEFKVFRHSIFDEKPISVQFCGQAVTPYSTRNPGLRLWQYDTDTCELLDYDQHYFPMNDTLPATELRWQHLYSAKDEFKLQDMSPNSWSGFIDRMNKDEAAWNNYYALYHSSKIGELPLKECKKGSICHHGYMCSASHVSYAGFHACLAI